MTQNGVYKNSDFAGQSIEEPTDYDVFGQGTDDSLDLRDWSVEVRQIRGIGDRGSGVGGRRLSAGGAH